MHRFKLEESRRKYETRESGQQDMIEIWDTSTEITTGSKKQLAALLRGIADEMDPPERQLR